MKLQHYDVIIVIRTAVTFSIYQPSEWSPCETDALIVDYVCRTSRKPNKAARHFTFRRGREIDRIEARTVTGKQEPFNGLLKAVFSSYNFYCIVRRVSNKFSGQRLCWLDVLEKSLHVTFTWDFGTVTKFQTTGTPVSFVVVITSCTTKFGVFEKNFLWQYLLRINTSKS